MTQKERYSYVLNWFRQHAPDAETELLYDNPYQLLVSVILSAQCTDKRVNLTTPAIFEKYPSPEQLSRASFDELFPYIKSISYPNNKTRHLIGMANMLVEQFNGEVPLTVEALMQLPGVGRKTANVITSVIDQQPNMAVDTHVFRVAARIGLTRNAKTPLAAEKQLIKNIPTEMIHKAHHWLILHGRYICVARNPKCEQCGLRPVCKYYQQMQRRPQILKPEGGSRTYGTNPGEYKAPGTKSQKTNLPRQAGLSAVADKKSKFKSGDETRNSKHTVINSKKEA
ncbi:endonuclease III [Agriterribacter humi]|uniref:endonuclease III n=1 Tax=Agriterribacter humi TaxID=1104781 RepID=UPI0012656542|nr:endonuclease III [Agriterribacter humi]